MAEPTGIKRYRVVIEFDVDHDEPVDSFPAAHPEDWSWSFVLKKAVPTVGYAKLVSAKEIEGEEE